LGITGAVGALSMADFVLLAKKELQLEVRVMMTEAATRFVSPWILQLHSGMPVLVDLFAPSAPYPVGHLQISDGVDAVLVMPASANAIARMAAGMADDAITATVLAAECPVIVVPSMNRRMWTHSLVQRNVRQLRDVGYRVMEPVIGVEVSTMKAELGGCPSFKAVIEEIADAVTQSREAVGAS